MFYTYKYPVDSIPHLTAKQQYDSAYSLVRSLARSHLYDRTNPVSIKATMRFAYILSCYPSHVVHHAMRSYFMKDDSEPYSRDRYGHSYRRKNAVDFIPF